MAINAVLRTLQQVRRRLTAVRAVESGLRWTLYGSMVAALAVALSALAFSYLPQGYPYPWPPLAIIPLAFVLGAAVRLLRPLSLRDAAVYLDRRAGLEERVATAYELEQQGDNSPLGNLVREEATVICRRFHAGTIRYGRRLTRDARYLVVALVVCAAVLLVPPLKTDGYKQRELQRQRSEAAITKLREFMKQIPRREISTDPQVEMMRQKINEALEKMGRGSAATPERNFAELNDTAEAIRKLQARNEAEKDLAKSVEQAKDVKGVDAAFKSETERQAMAEKMAGGKLSAEEKQALQKIGRASSRAGEASGDEQLKEAGDAVRQACSSGQGDSGELSESMDRISKAAGEASARQGGEAAGQRDQELADALAAVDAAKASQSGAEKGGSRTADAGQPKECGTCGGTGKDAQGNPCSDCGGTGQEQPKQCESCGGTGKDAQGNPCSDCGGTGKQPGGQQGGNKQGEGQKGSGQKPCGDCKGTGKNASGGKCDTCNGAGQVSSGGTRQAGSGSTNMDQPSGTGGKATHRDVTPERKFVQIYDARKTAHSTEKVYAPGTIGDGESAGRKMIAGGANPNEEAKIAFGQSFTAEGARQAEESLEENPVPADVRDMVRRYFTPDNP